MQVGKTEDQGLYNKPSAAVHPGALAAGTLPQYNTMSCHLGSDCFPLRGIKYSETNYSQHFTNEDRVKKNTD